MSRNIAIFADGTGNTVGKHDSNVLRLCKMFDIRQRSEQLLIYDPGVGTLTTKADLERTFPTPDGPLYIEDSIAPYSTNYAIKWLGLGFGLGTERNIKQLYLALAKHYHPGDHVYIFGFSRGAFTARSLAGFIYRCGLLQPGHINAIDDAYDLYRQHFEQAKNSHDLRIKKRNIDEFKQECSYPCNVRFLGIFDTVKSVGYFRPKNLPHTRHNPIVETVRHALSLDERRSFYAPTTWGGLDGDTRPATFVPACWGSGANNDPPIRWQDVKEVWFAGCHSDVGGGYAPDASSPADVSLRWMLEEARAHGLRLSPDANVSGLARTIIKEHLHNEMTRRGTWIDLGVRMWWRCADHLPRRDLDNEPPPPRKNWRVKPAGPREIGASLRRGGVTIHSTAVSCYPEATPPWMGLAARVIATTEHHHAVAKESAYL
jgi:uncharacterized protein (DUF2235 family)